MDILDKRPPYIKNTYGVNLADLISYLDSEDRIKVPREFILDCWSRLVNEELVSVHNIASDLEMTVAGVRKRLDQLTNFGVLEKTQIRIKGVKRPVNEYVFTCIGKKLEEHDLKQVITIDQVPGLSTSTLPYSKTRMRIDDVVLTSLFSALDYKVRRKPTHSKKLTINWFNAWVDLIVRSETDTIGAAITDLRYLIVAYSYCYETIRNEVKYGNKPDNNFSIEIEIINRLMGKSNSGGNIETALRAFERISNTVFEFKRIPLFIQQRHEFSGNQKINLLSSYGVYWSEKNSKDKKTFINFHVPHFIFTKMITEKGFFIIHPELPKEDHPMILALHLYGRRVIGHKTTVHMPTLLELHADIAPQLNIKEFCHNLELGLIQHFDKNCSVENGDIMNVQEGKIVSAAIDVYGYIVNYNLTDEGEAIISMVINPTDEILGLQSKHRRLLKKAAQGELNLD
mgnify:FL=1